jgi:DNA-binding response OmpR family regulator
MIVESCQHHLRSFSHDFDGLSHAPNILSENDGQLAIERTNAEAIDLFIVDAYLRGKVDGFDLCRALRASVRGKNTPIILVLSGYLSLERFKAIAAGADLLLYRPIIKEELIRMTELVLGLKYSRSEPNPTALPHVARRLKSAV